MVGAKPQILAVDDEPSSLELLEAILVAEGYVVSLFTNGQQALNSAMHNPPELVLLDVYMPGIDGFTVCRQLLANADMVNLPVIFLSGASDEKDKIKAFHCGGIDYVGKPFNPEELCSRVQTHLSLYRVRCSQASRVAELHTLLQQRNRDLEKSRVEILHRLAVAGECRDEDTGKHTQRVGRNSSLLAKALGMTEAESRLIRLAAPLHDVGKIGVPDHILLSSGRLSAEEFEAMKLHVSIGSRILSGSQSPLLQMAECIAQFHHERWDGSGYLKGLAGADIPLPARIVAVVDAFDALTHRRSYKAAWSAEAALDELKRQSGRHFDPSVVSTMVRLVEDDVITSDPPIRVARGGDIFASRSGRTVRHTAA